MSRHIRMRMFRDTMDLVATMHSLIQRWLIIGGVSTKMLNMKVDIRLTRI